MSLSIVTFMYNRHALKTCHITFLLKCPVVPLSSWIRARTRSIMAQSFSFIGVGVHALFILIFPFVVHRFSHMYVNGDWADLRVDIGIISGSVLKIVFLFKDIDDKPLLPLSLAGRRDHCVSSFLLVDGYVVRFVPLPCWCILILHIFLVRR